MPDCTHFSDSMILNMGSCAMATMAMAGMSRVASILDVKKKIMLTVSGLSVSLAMRGKRTDWKGPDMTRLGMFEKSVLIENMPRDAVPKVLPIMRGLMESLMK